MPTIERQIELEKEMSSDGAEAYSRRERAAEEAGRGAETAYARRLMKEFMVDLVGHLEEFLASGGAKQHGRVRGLLRRIPAATSMYITLKAVFNSFTYEEQVVQTASRIGRMIEDEARFSRFQEMHSDYYDTIIKDFKRKGTSDYRHMHRVMTHMANDYKDQWVVWSPVERVDVGTRLLDIVLRFSDLIEKVTVKSKGKTKTTLVPTDSASEWVEKHEEMGRLMFPERSPCVIEPDKWTGMQQGGYYTPQLRSNTPMVKTNSGRQHKLLGQGDLTAIQDVLNTVQEVPWAVNNDVLQVVRAAWAQNLGIGMPASDKLVPDANPLKDVPKDQMTEEQLERFSEWKMYAAEVYTQDKQRVGKTFQITRIIRMATEYQQYSRFWYVWYMDFRGRLYSATAGFSPQGPDIAKGLLQFAEGKPLGARGLYWLKVHGANRYGFDKASYDERVAWVDARHDFFMAAAADPLAHTEVWKDADKPWQFLAFLFEYRQAMAFEQMGMGGRYVSRLPIGLDGSCNGLQHFSAMLRDEVGGAATNLVPADKPADIYSQVAKVCHDAVKRHKGDGDIGDKWLDFCKQHGNDNIPRSLAKRPVMTLPYGATRQSCTRYVHSSIIETDKEMFSANFGAAVWLTPILWKSIGEVVIAARDGMEWLQKSATAMSREKLPIIWHTPDGFPVVQDMRVIKTVQIDTQLAGRFQVRVGDRTDELDKSKQRNGISPNFVHSQDANHLRATIRLAKSRGITNFAVVHDDYGTHACDTDALHAAIREAFVSMYADNDNGPLEAFKAEQEAAGGELPDIPVKGSLDVSQVTESKYFFG